MIFLSLSAISRRTLPGFHLMNLLQIGDSKDAVIRNFEVIGEAIKNLPSDLKERYPKTDWKKIAGFRDVLTHAYFGVKPTILWDISVNNLPLLKTEIRHILTSEESKK
jgi:uncharacterized protein with HEPN domain